jgi:hypothetical protein
MTPMRRNRFVIGLALSLASLLTSAASAIARADVVIAPPPSGTSSDQAAQFGTATANVVNQSGLSIPYTPGVTDFDSYLAMGPTHQGGPIANVWLFEGTVANFDMNFGAPVRVDAIAIWNKDDIFGTNAFRLLAADNPSFTGAVELLSTNLAQQPPNPTPTPFQRFDFATTTDQYFRIAIESNYGAFFTGLGEVAFAGVVPEPSSAILAAFGAVIGLAYGWSRRRRG